MVFNAIISLSNHQSVLFCSPVLWCRLTSYPCVSFKFQLKALFKYFHVTIMQRDWFAVLTGCFNCLLLFLLQNDLIVCLFTHSFFLTSIHPNNTSFPPNFSSFSVLSNFFDQSNKALETCITDSSILLPTFPNLPQFLFSLL